MPPVLSVSQFVILVNDTLAMIPSGAFVVEGEVADYKVAQGKWINFTLKDESADVRLPCFATTFKGLPTLSDGMRVRLTGYATIFPRFGKFSLNVETAEPVGEGALQKAYEALRVKLEADGVFDAGRKRRLPYMPKRIGLITSREAAAYGDFLRILGNRMGGIEIVHVNVHVQGQYAVDEICEAFTMINALPKDERPEVLVLTRGGGSFEELHAFNDERVVRAVFSCRVPVVVGVGHERDETLCDFVADFRASTPSNAAECLVPQREELERDIRHMVTRMDMQLSREISLFRARVERATVVFDHALTLLQANIDTCGRTVTRGIHLMMERLNAKLISSERLLNGIDPKRVLSRGYAIVRDAQGKVLRDAAGVAPGTSLSVQLAAGQLAAKAVGDDPIQERLL